MEYATNGKANLGVTLGAIGTGLGALGNIGLLGGGMMGYGRQGGWNGWNNGNGYCGNEFVTRYELNMANQMAEKDSEIAFLKAESDAERKMIEVYKQTRSEIKELQHEVDANRREQDAWNASQSVANAQMTAAVATNTNSIMGIQDVLRRITAVRVPNYAVCPGWGDVTITPVTPAPTVASSAATA